MRSKSTKIRSVAVDGKYKSLEVAKLMNRVMVDGKRTVAMRQV